MLDNFAKGGFDVFAGSEVFLLDNMRNGGKGCITATGNINPGPIANVYKNWRSADADKLQAGITATRKIVQKQPMIPALKSAVAHFGNDPQWKTCRPPLIELTSTQEKELISELKAAGFTMPGPGVKTALVTGAARGIGRAAADALAKAGFRVLRLDLEGEITVRPHRPRRHSEAGRFARRDPRPGQQRRRAERGRHRGLHRGAAQAHPAHQPGSAGRADPTRCRKQMIARGSRPHRQPRLGRRVHRAYRPLVRRHQGRRGELHAQLRRAPRAERHPGERGRARARSTPRSSTARSPSASSS